MKFIDYISEKVGFFDKDADYMIREIGSNEYEVTKWIKGKNPDEIYRCFHNKSNNKWSCSCPVKVMPCKHVKMTKSWLAAGKPNPYEPKDIQKWVKELFGDK